MDLPGPASWWLEDPEYYTVYGWDFSHLDPTLAFQALTLIITDDKQEAPPEFDLLLGIGELTLLSREAAEQELKITRGEPVTELRRTNRLGEIEDLVGELETSESDASEELD